MKGATAHTYMIHTGHSERPIEGARGYTHPAFAPCRVMLAVRSRRPGSRAWRPQTTGATRHSHCGRSNLPAPARARSATADAGAPAGLVQLEHLYTPGNCAGDAASVPSWIFSGQLAKSVRNRRTSADGGAGQIPHAWPTAAPRPPSLTAPCPPPSVHRQARWRPTHRYTSSVGNGWTQTQIQGTTDTRTSHQGGRGPQTLTGPYPIAPRQRGSPHTRVSGGHGLRTNAISLNIPSVMQRWVGGHHASATAQTGLMTPEGRR